MEKEILPAGADPLQQLDDWRVILGRLHARFEIRDFAAGLSLVNEIGRLAEQADHHPDIDLRYTSVYLRLVSHDVGGLTMRDVRLAREISQAAHDQGAASTPERTAELEVALDAVNHPRIGPFWRAVFGLPVTSADPTHIRPDEAPLLWFQESDEERPGRGRFHLDLNVPHDVAEQRVADALAAGGTLVSDDHAKAWWVLADEDGNEVCICTWQDREES